MLERKCKTELSERTGGEKCKREMQGKTDMVDNRKLLQSNAIREDCQRIAGQERIKKKVFIFDQ